MRTYNVGVLKPNDFGLFDTLGNAIELCQVSDVPIDSLFRAIFCGGSIINSDVYLTFDLKRGPTIIHQRTGVGDVGFRVARTVRPRAKRK
jgi:formylglycine-generating enzyme required for sulfatase activity